jgi:tellurite resistance protein
MVAVMTDVIQNENRYRRYYSRDYMYTVVVVFAAVSVVDKECIDVEKANSMLLLLPIV